MKEGEGGRKEGREESKGKRGKGREERKEVSSWFDTLT